MARGDSHRLASCSFDILCLGEMETANLNDDQRVKILRYVAKHRNLLSCTRLEKKAVQCALHELRMS